MPVFEWWNDNWYALDFSGQGWGGWEPKQTWELAASRGDWEVQAKIVTINKEEYPDFIYTGIVNWVNTLTTYVLKYLIGWIP